MIFSVTIRADDNVVSIKKGEIAPFTGILFTEQKADDVRRQILELEKQRYLVQSRDEKLDIFQVRFELKDEQIELFRQQNDRLVKQNQTNRSVGSIERMVWFGLGILATGAAVYGAGSLAK